MTTRSAGTASTPWHGIDGFICYSREDSAFVERLHRKLKALEVNGVARFFRDTQSVPPGGRWDAEIRAALYRSALVLAVLSDDFFNSDYIVNYELPAMLQLAEERSLTIIPIVARDCLWEESPLHAFSALPPDGIAAERSDDPAAMLQLIGKHVARQALALTRARPVYTQPPLHYGDRGRGATAGVRVTLGARFTQAAARKAERAAAGLVDLLGGRIKDIRTRAGSIILDCRMAWSTLDSLMSVTHASLPVLGAAIETVELCPSERVVYSGEPSPVQVGATVVAIVDERFVPLVSGPAHIGGYEFLATLMARQLDFDSLTFDDSFVAMTGPARTRFDGRAVAMSVAGEEIDSGRPCEIEEAEPGLEDGVPSVLFGGSGHSVCRVGANDAAGGLGGRDVAQLVAEVDRLAPRRRVVVLFTDDVALVGQLAAIFDPGRAAGSRFWFMNAGRGLGRERDGAEGSSVIWVRRRALTQASAWADTARVEVSELVSGVVETSEIELRALHAERVAVESAVIPVPGAQALVETLRQKVVAAFFSDSDPSRGPRIGVGVDGSPVPIWNL